VSQNSAWGGALLCPMTPYGAHGHMPHATCGAMLGPIKASQRAMDTTYDLLWCIVIDITTHGTLTRRLHTHLKNCMGTALYGNPLQRAY
jgi:hypothetical protein